MAVKEFKMMDWALSKQSKVLKTTDDIVVHGNGKEELVSNYLIYNNGILFDAKSVRSVADTTSRRKTFVNMYDPAAQYYWDLPAKYSALASFILHARYWVESRFGNRAKQLNADTVLGAYKIANNSKISKITGLQNVPSTEIDKAYHAHSDAENASLYVESTQSENSFISIRRGIKFLTPAENEVIFDMMRRAYNKQQRKCR